MTTASYLIKKVIQVSIIMKNGLKNWSVFAGFNGSEMSYIDRVSDDIRQNFPELSDTKPMILFLLSPISSFP